MISMFEGILVGESAYHMTCLTEEELFSIFGSGGYVQFSKSENYVSKMYPKVVGCFRCVRCHAVIGGCCGKRFV